MKRIKLLAIFIILIIIMFADSPALADWFLINQSANTSQGNISRYIDLSSPWSGYYIFEDFVIEGRAEINDSFRMINIGYGYDNSINNNWQVSDNFEQRGLPAFDESFNTGLSIGNTTGSYSPVRNWLSFF